MLFVWNWAIKPTLTVIAGRTGYEFLSYATGVDPAAWLVGRVMALQPYMSAEGLRWILAGGISLLILLAVEIIRHRRKPVTSPGRKGHSVEYLPDINAAEGFKLVLTRSLWAKNLVENDLLDETGMYEPEDDIARINQRLTAKLDREIHDLLGLGQLRAWGRRDSSHPPREIKKEEWDDIEIHFDPRSLSSTPPNICAWERKQQGRLRYVGIHFCKEELLERFPVFAGAIQFPARPITLLKPPFQYEISWYPPNDLQIITQITFIPSGKTKPDTRIPVFYVKNLSTEFLRNVVVKWTLGDDIRVESAVLQSRSLQNYEGTILSDFMGSSAIPHKALQLAHESGGSRRAAALTYELAEVQKLEFIDPTAEVEVCPMRVFAAVEVYLAARLAGAVMDTLASATMLCTIEARGHKTTRFRIHITGRSVRSKSAVDGIVQNTGDDMKAVLTFNVQKL